MRVRIGGRTFDSDNQMVIIHLTGQEKRLIAGMAPDAFFFSVRPSGYQENVAQSVVETFRNAEEEEGKLWQE